MERAVWNDGLAGRLMVLLEDVSTGQSKFINKELAALLFTNTRPYVTDDIINGKPITGYFESLKEF